MRASDDQDKPCGTDVPCLELGSSDLRLQISESRDDFDCNARRAVNQEDVGCTQIASDWDWSLDNDTPGASDPSEEGGDMPRLSRVADSTAHRPQSDREAEADSGGMDRQLLASQAP
jgi:hypothetical protein